MISLSTILIVGILICLINIVDSIKKECLTAKEKIFVKLPFSVCFGWMTVETIASVTALLVSFGWNGFGISEAVWTVAIILKQRLCLWSGIAMGILRNVLLARAKINSTL